MFFEINKKTCFSSYFLKNNAVEHQIIKHLIKFSSFFIIIYILQLIFDYIVFSCDEPETVLNDMFGGMPASMLTLFMAGTLKYIM